MIGEDCIGPVPGLPSLQRFKYLWFAACARACVRASASGSPSAQLERTPRAKVQSSVSLPVPKARIAKPPPPVPQRHTGALSTRIGTARPTHRCARQHVARVWATLGAPEASGLQGPCLIEEHTRQPTPRETAAAADTPGLSPCRRAWRCAGGAASAGRPRPRPRGAACCGWPRPCARRPWQTRASWLRSPSA